MLTKVFEVNRNVVLPVIISDDGDRCMSKELPTTPFETLFLSMAMKTNRMGKKGKKAKLKYCIDEQCIHDVVS